MLVLAKVALGLGATLAMTTAYVFHEGVVRVDVDERRPGGSHVHVWVPATAVSAGMRVASRVSYRSPGGGLPACWVAVIGRSYVRDLRSST